MCIRDRFRDIDKETVDFVPNYDSTTTEPTLLPVTFPTCLLYTSIFTGGGVKVDGMCSAAFCESAALRQTFRLNCKVTGFARGSPFEERLPPLLSLIHI